MKTTIEAYGHHSGCPLLRERMEKCSVEAAPVLADSSHPCPACSTTFPCSGRYWGNIWLAAAFPSKISCLLGMRGPGELADGTIPLRAV